ncbi:MAG: glycoside hydrolase family 2 protein [Christensenellales bacterium]
MEEVRRQDGGLRITLAADTFAHAFRLNVGGDARLSDHYFDMLPGDRRTILLEGEVPEQLNVAVLPD